MREDFDALLTSGLIAPPDDFTQRVMAQIDSLPPPAFPARPVFAHRSREKIQRLALALTALAGAAQVITYMFGIWAASAVG